MPLPSTISPGSTSNSSPAGISASTSSNAAPTTRTPSKVSGGIIAAIVVPIVFALVAVLLLFWYLRRRRKNQRYLRGVAQEKLDKAREEDRGRLELDARANEIFHAGSAALPAQADSTPMYQIDSSSRTIEQDRSTIDGGNGGAAELYSPVSPPPLAQTFATNPRSLGSETPPPDHSPTEVVLSGERPRSLAEAPDTEIPRSHPQSLTTASGSAQPDVQSARNSTADSVSDIFYDPLPEPDSASSQGITEPETPPGRQGLQQKLSELRANRQVLERINEMRRQEQLLEKRIAMMNPD
ncbi:MAG: hypothetical protein M1814_000591 [Vezdaea aestivalis]|nr:MAG: hypothetical protein M1814_000591 [Vezdaea aestivalis]